VVERFGKKPERFGERVAGVLGRVGGSKEEMRAAVAGMRGVWAEMVALTAGAYRARFDLGAAKG
ncbi:MAG: hypothetical protein J0L64_27910, partial [Acidobacteria bacterium]|nr:hypothetical protein [Acidobacteriota bacterium]